MKFFVRDTNITLLRTGEFPENGAVRTIRFLMQIKLIFFVYREALWHFESKVRLGKDCVLRFSIHRSQPSYSGGSWLISCSESRIFTVLLWFHCISRDEVMDNA